MARAFPPIQAKLTVNTPGDAYEQEADRMADLVMRMPEPSLPVGADQRVGPSPFRAGTPIQRADTLVRPYEGGPSGVGAQHAAPSLSRQATAAPAVGPAFEASIEAQRGAGIPLSQASRAFFEPRFGQDFSRVRVHADDRADRLSRQINARAFTLANNVFFARSEYQPESARGRSLLAHELTHVVQQGHASRNHLQREEAAPAGDPDELTGPLSDAEWRSLQSWQNRGEVGGEPLTADPDHNALVVADALFCARLIGSSSWDSSEEDPLLCVMSEVTRADPRVQQLATQVAARGPIVNWAVVDPDQRMLHVMDLLVGTYGFPANGAAGLVGNLWAESGVLPSRIEGSDIATPMTARDARGRTTDFTAEEVMTRDPGARQGPRRPGIGLAQWTTEPRRSELFQHTYQGRQQGAGVLFNMDAQVDYLVHELQTRRLYAGVNALLRRQGVSLEDASDEVVYRFEVPGEVLSGDDLKPRNDPDVQTVFRLRRGYSRQALEIYQQAHREE